MQSCVLMLEAALLNYEVIMINFALFHDQVTVGTSHPVLPHAVCPFCWGCHILSVLILSPTCWWCPCLEPMGRIPSLLPNFPRFRPGEPEVWQLLESDHHPAMTFTVRKFVVSWIMLCGSVLLGLQRSPYYFRITVFISQFTSFLAAVPPPVWFAALLPVPVLVILGWAWSNAVHSPTWKVT